MKKKNNEKIEKWIANRKKKINQTKCNETNQKEIYFSIWNQIQKKMFEQIEKNAKTTYVKKQLKIATRIAQNVQLLVDFLNI